MRWFKHFTKSLTDAKIEKLIMKYGIEGYGLYFACLEIIAGSVSEENITFELEHDAEIIAHKFKLDTLKTERMMKFMVGLGLFEFNETSGRITCFKLAQYIDRSMIKNPKLLNVKKKLVNTFQEKLLKAPENSCQIRLDKIRLDKKRKEDNTPERRKYADNITLTEEEHQKLLNLYGSCNVDKMVKYLSDYKIEKGYKTKSDYLTIKRWVVDACKVHPTTKPPIVEKERFTPEERKQNAELKKTFNARLSAILNKRDKIEF